ncbi:MAG TPA: acetyltransferase [Gammaproteobacteria bacterium]|nr:acetyltransferase [Gammaproteobacteria bacterium]
MIPEERRRLAEAVREACLEAAKKGYEEASQSGLCHEGAVEASLDAVRMVDLKALLAALGEAKKPG